MKLDEKEVTEKKKGVGAYNKIIQIYKTPLRRQWGPTVSLRSGIILYSLYVEQTVKHGNGWLRFGSF